MPTSASERPLKFEPLDLNRSMTDHQHALHAANEQRAQAEELLNSLLDAKRQTESTALESTRRDLFKRVTGKSSLDNAIASTRRTIDAYSRLISDQERGINSTVFCVSSAGVPSAL